MNSAEDPGGIRGKMWCGRRGTGCFHPGTSPDAARPKCNFVRGAVHRTPSQSYAPGMEKTGNSGPGPENWAYLALRKSATQKKPGSVPLEGFFFFFKFGGSPPSPRAFDYFSLFPAGPARPPSVPFAPPPTPSPPSVRWTPPGGVPPGSHASQPPGRGRMPLQVVMRDLGGAF
jgi:hypothetical protein